MNEALIRFNNFSVYGYGLLVTFAFLWGSFVYYKKAIEAHFEDKVVLDSIVICGFWSFIGGRIAFAILNWGTFASHLSRLFLLTNYPGVDRWGVIGGLALGLWLCLRKIKVRFLDWFDFVALGVTAGSAIFCAGIFLFSFVWQYVVLAVLYLLAFVYFWYAEETYRVLDWYRNKKTSAKSGYISGLSISVWGLLFLVERWLNRNMSWQLILWSALLFVGGLILVYIRSGRTVAEDIKIIFKHGRK